MQFIKSDIDLDFIGKRKVAFALSLVMIIISIASLLIHKGPRLGIDFAGGTLIQFQFEGPVKMDDIRKGLQDINLKVTSLQLFDNPANNEYLIQIEQGTAMGKGFSDKFSAALKAATGSGNEIRRLEMVGPKVGKDLREKALFAMFYALLFISIYISGRFELKWLISIVVAIALAFSVYLLSSFKVSIPVLIIGALISSLVLFWVLKLKFAMGAIVALIHDVTITIGIFSIFNKEFSLPIIAALLTIIGYSLNDTIIVYDRIRENIRRYRKKSLATTINRSVNETLSRTILTSITTLVVVVALFIFGGGIIHDFAFALIVGVAVGTYSSIYVASPILLTWQKDMK